MASVQELMEKKNEIEKELAIHSQTLEQNNSVGMDGQLVDREGYPRSDIDVYEVRRARNRIICLRNDHKKLMAKIQEKLYDIHEEARESGTVSSGSQPGKDKKLDPFARVTMVTEGSPASTAGLRIGDLLIEFGSVRVDNFTSLSNISSVVQHSVNKPVRVTVLREGVSVSLSLCPREWRGRGLLGCVINPLK